jgi:hypothetical protein
MVLLSQAGCSVWQQARRTLLNEPAQYSWKLDKSRSLKAYRQWADEVWAVESGAIPEMAGDEEYALGFRDGFVDYVYAGGDGQPPPIPPRKFWNVAWRNAPGQAAAQQWFAGYRHGADAARTGGYRQNGIVASAYCCDGAGGWQAETRPRGYSPLESLSPAGELIPIPPAPSGYDDGQLPAPPMPADATPADAQPENALRDDTPLPELEPAEPAPSPATDAVLKFRRAVSTVHFLQPTSTP